MNAENRPDYECEPNPVPAKKIFPAYGIDLYACPPLESFEHRYPRRPRHRMASRRLRRRLLVLLAAALMVGFVLFGTSGYLALAADPADAAREARGRASDRNVVLEVVQLREAANLRAEMARYSDWGGGR